MIFQACRNFYDDGVCKQECPPMQRYNSITYSWERNPNGKYAYLANELDNTTVVMEVQANGGLSIIQTISTLPPETDTEYDRITPVLNISSCQSVLVSPGTLFT